MAVPGTPIKLPVASLYKKLTDLVSEWELLGIYLEIPRDKMKAIGSVSNNKTMEKKFIEMLEQFMLMEDGCTWANVADALESMGNVRLARKMREKYGQGKIVQDIPDVQVSLQECLPDWSTFGLMLGISKTYIDIIDEKEHYSRPLTQVLDYWLKNSKDSTWEVLIKAVKDVGNKRLGNELAKEFLKN